MRERNNNFISILSAFAVGSLIGAGIALLMAPQSGEETRAMIRNRSMEMKERAAEAADETRQRAEKAMGDVAQQTRQTAEEAKRRSEELMQGKGRT